MLGGSVIALFCVLAVTTLAAQPAHAQYDCGCDGGYVDAYPDSGSSWVDAYPDTGSSYVDAYPDSGYSYVDAYPDTTNSYVDAYPDTYSNYPYDYQNYSTPYSSPYTAGSFSYSMPNYSSPIYSNGSVPIISTPGFTYTQPTFTPTVNNNTNTVVSGGDVNTNNNSTGPVNVTTGPTNVSTGPVNVNVSVPGGNSNSAPVYYPIPQPYTYAQPQTPFYYNPRPASVSLSQVPYTGLDLGTWGTMLYWLFLIAWCAFGAYLIVVKRVQNKVVDSFSSLVAGKASTSSHGIAQPAHASHTASHAHAPKKETDYTDDFVLAQIARRA